MDDHLRVSGLAGGRRASASAMAPNHAFRADTDQAGEWYVWTRLGAMGAPVGWATMQRCESREVAQRLADDLNQRSLRVAV